MHVFDTERNDAVANLTSSNANLSASILWHRRMGHLNFSDLNKLPSSVEYASLTHEEGNDTVASKINMQGCRSRMTVQELQNCLKQYILISVER